MQESWGSQRGWRHRAGGSPDGLQTREGDRLPGVAQPISRAGWDPGPPRARCFPSRTPHREWRGPPSEAGHLTQTGQEGIMPSPISPGYKMETEFPKS